MTIKVEAVWGGRSSGFRLTLPNGDREQVAGDKWTRRLASQALDILEHVYHLKRSTIRFYVH
jgi:hypothetical protein